MRVAHRFERVVEGVLLRRYNRFLADVRLSDGSEVTAHCPNTGSMHGLLDEVEPRVLLSRSDDPSRKLAFTLVAIHVREPEAGPAGAWVGVFSARANAMVGTALARGWIEELRGFRVLEREVTVGESRADFRLTFDEATDGALEAEGKSSPVPPSSSTTTKRGKDRRASSSHSASTTIVEVKSATLGDYVPATVRPNRDAGRSWADVAELWDSIGLPPPSELGTASPPPPTAFVRSSLFPDTVSERALKHVLELTRLASSSSSSSSLSSSSPLSSSSSVPRRPPKACLIMLLQRDDCLYVRPCDRAHRAYADAVRAAASLGVLCLGYRVKIHPSGEVEWLGRVPVDLRAPEPTDAAEAVESVADDEAAGASPRPGSRGRASSKTSGPRKPVRRKRKGDEDREDDEETEKETEKGVSLARSQTAPAVSSAASSSSSSSLDRTDGSRSKRSRASLISHHFPTLGTSRSLSSSSSSSSSSSTTPSAPPLMASQSAPSSRLDSLRRRSAADASERHRARALDVASESSSGEEVEWIDESARS